MMMVQNTLILIAGTEIITMAELPNWVVIHDFHPSA